MTKTDLMFFIVIFLSNTRSYVTTFKWPPVYPRVMSNLITDGYVLIELFKLT